MARGWESKAVEDQVNEHEAEAISAGGNSSRLTDDERVKNNHLRSLDLSRSRIADQLKRASHPSHRTMLERALAALDEQIAELNKIS